MAVDVGQTVRALEMAGTFGDGTVIDRHKAEWCSCSAPKRMGKPRSARPSRSHRRARSQRNLASGGRHRALGRRVYDDRDPAAKRITGAVAVGTVDETMPLRDFVKSFSNRPSEVSRTDVVTTHIAALEGAFDYDGASDAVAVHQLGLGSETSKVTRDGVTLLGIDVNASAGRHVDVRVTADPQQVLRLDIAPSFQLDLEYKMASVNPLVQNLETFVLDDTLTIQAEGARGSSSSSRPWAAWLSSRTRPVISWGSRPVASQ